jgi:hypothetical protein
MATLRAIRRRNAPLEAPYDLRGVGLAFGTALLSGATIWAVLIAAAIRIL